MKKLKYIGFDDGGDRTTYITFPETISHDVMARHAGKAMNGEPVSAGFVTFREVQGVPVCICYGNSVSLNLSTRDNDSKDMSFEYFGLDSMFKADDYVKGKRDEN